MHRQRFFLFLVESEIVDDFMMFLSFLLFIISLTNFSTAMCIPATAYTHYILVACGISGEKHRYEPLAL